MTSYEFMVAAKNAIIETVAKVYEENYLIEDIQVVTQYYILGYIKGTFIDNGHNGRYYEVTYNKANNEMYLDVYRKEVNRVVKSSDFNLKA